MLAAAHLYLLFSSLASANCCESSAVWWVISCRSSQGTGLSWIVGWHWLPAAQAVADICLLCTREAQDQFASALSSMHVFKTRCTQLRCYRLAKELSTTATLRPDARAASSAGRSGAASSRFAWSSCCRSSWFSRWSCASPCSREECQGRHQCGPCVSSRAAAGVSCQVGGCESWQPTAGTHVQHRQLREQ